jgi:mono/diheme cytochrome c family protein
MRLVFAALALAVLTLPAVLTSPAVWADGPTVAGKEDRPTAAANNPPADNAAADSAAANSAASDNGSTVKAPADKAADKPVDFAHQILPLLKQRCSRCHTAGTYKGDLSMDTREDLLKAKALIPGDSANSEIIARVTSTDTDQRMPAKGDPLPAEQIALLRRWIDEGAPWQDGFSFARQKTATVSLELKRPELPPAVAGREHPIDRLVDAYFAQNKLPFPPPVDDATFARRVYLDLVGLLPTPQQLEEFLANQSPNKRQWLIDKLLTSDVAYADHWLTFWNDLLRNDYTGTGYIDGGRKQITQWLYSSLLENKPYDQFVRQLISPSPASEGFIDGIKWRGTVNAAQSPELQFAQNVGQVFLGVNLKCASCHDSFIDDWKLTDSWGLASVKAEHPLEMYRCDVPTGKTAPPAFLFPELGSIDPAAPRPERLEQLAQLITDSRNGRLSRTLVNRVWHRLLGRGIVHPVDAMDGTPWSGDLLDYLACELTDNGYDVKMVLRLIATSQIYQARCAEPADSAAGDGPVFRGPIARRLTAEQFLDAVWRITETSPAKPLNNAEDKKLSLTFEGRGNEPVRAALMKCDLLMRSLGRPNRDQVVTTRPDDLSTLEALDLTNGPAMAKLMAAGAAKWRKEHPDKSVDDTIKWFYSAALCRQPTDAEIADSRQILGDSLTDDSLSDFMWCVFMLPEFQLVK